MDATLLNEVQRSLGRIEGKTDALLVNQERLREDYDGLRKDVDNLRFKLNWYSGGLATAGTVFMLFRDKITALITG